jgi:nucleotide-binding universal stress UspA family protein
MGEVGQVDEIADLAAFLLSDRSSVVSGSSSTGIRSSSVFRADANFTRTNITSRREPPMPVAVAHLPSTTGHLALREAAQQAVQRRTSLTVIQVVDAVDLDVNAAHRAGLSDEIGNALAEAGIADLKWDLQLAASPDRPDDTADTILSLADQAGADLLVIGGRRRSPVGKAFLGSVTQNLILAAGCPVLVVKSSE